MFLFDNLNIITILMILIFFIPLLAGAFYPISSNRVYYSVLSSLNFIKLIVGIILTFYFTRIIFSGQESVILETLYKHIPSLGQLITTYQHDIVAYIIGIFVLLFIILCILELITIPLYRFGIAPLTDKLLSILKPMNSKIKRVFSGAWQLPRSLCMVLIFSLLLNFYTTYINNPSAGKYINDSKAYQLINTSLLSPILSTDLVKQLPVLISDSFKRAAEDFTPANNDNPNYWNLPVIKYFNGMTLDEAIRTNDDIDSTAKQIVGDESNDLNKAYLLYEWISKNIDYDKDKAKIIANDSFQVNSGSIITYNERRGICFDYASLYISMCRAVGLKVRFVTGLGYSGVEWGDHAWNQVYVSAENRWINVDTTFASSGLSSFDSSNFADYHKYDVVQAEW